MNYEFVTGGPCRLNCQPKYCDQSCPQGGCTITCPSDNKVCQQMCGPGKQCTKEIMPPPTTPATTTVTTAPPFVPDECESLEDGVCYQFCPGGSCVLECFNSTYYIIHVLNLAVVRILFHSICKFRWVCFTESDQFALIWQFLLKNNMTQYGDIQWSNTVKDSCSLHVRTITWWNQHSPVVNRTSFFFQVEIAAWHVLAPNIVCAPVQVATALQCFVKQIPPNLIVLLANVKRNVMRTAASKIVQVEASLCSVTLTAAIRNVLVKPAKSTASQTTESNYVNCQLPPRASVWRAV